MMMMDENPLRSIMDLPPVREFDAFPKTDPIYIQRSKRGGIFTLMVGTLILVLVYYELKDYLFSEAVYSFNVDQSLDRSLDINIDLTVAMPCHYLSIDIRDAVGDRMHVSDELKKEGTVFEVKGAKTIDRQNSDSNTASKALTDSSRTFLESWSKPKFPKTKPLVEDGPACRIFGNVEVKKVAGNFHITTLGHGYLSWEHTDHKLMNLTHVIKELSFGDFFPRIVQPLDNSLEVTSKRK
ncbi:endoplasmic reticulum-golgi intermediate compartment-domain-containing protein [Phakopsora pachyrhizi]|nr:endoplasmic reticulum-golgi intermediate compartment-domain-containing protein [Phakopsora pachyrhizi]